MRDRRSTSVSPSGIALAMPLTMLALAGGLLLLGGATPIHAATSAAGEVPRTPDGRPDLTGTYDVATLTPQQRPQSLGNRQSLTDEEAREIAESEQARLAKRDQTTDPDREAPPTGGDGSTGASGNVGGYNAFWIDRGSGAFKLDGKWRTSIITDPPNGRRPPMTDQAIASRRARFSSYRRKDGSFRQNDGIAWWIDEGGPDAPGSYDDPEQRGLGERCLLGFGSTSGPPMMPVLYNNLKKIIQTPDYVMILVEMVHDARIVRMNAEHDPPEIRKWLGDSVGHWEGDTLIVDTTNFGSRRGLSSSSENLHVIERFTRIDEDTLLYQFTVDDPTVWTAPWSGEYPWPATDDRVFEYACHEGNYALGNILRGARLLEAEALETLAKKKAAGESQD